MAYPVSGQPQYYPNFQAGGAVPTMSTTSSMQHGNSGFVTGGHNLNLLANAAGMQQAPSGFQAPAPGMNKQQQSEGVATSVATQSSAGDPSSSNGA